MKRLHFSSFRQRLNAAFLAVSLVPMLLCSGLLLQIFRLRMTSNAQQTAQQQLSASCEALDTLHSGFLQTAASLQHNPLVAQALFDAEAEDTAVYSQLFDATESVRSFARFDLYDISGRWRYSTQTAPEIRSLPTNWGLLYEAACAGTGVLVCSAAEDPADTDEPLLHAAMLLTDRYGAPVGYLTIGMLETQLQTLLGGTAGAQNELLLLDARWRPVYCTQPAQTQSLADALRGQLLSGKALTGLSADVSYTVRQHTETGLYLVLQPLAENAILHGLSGVEHGELSVTAVLAEQDVLEIRVRDNGCGFPPDLLGPYKPPETQTGHLGLLNVDTILRKHYGDAFGLRLENPEGGGACILARLPAKGGPGV